MTPNVIFSIMLYPRTIWRWLVHLYMTTNNIAYLLYNLIGATSRNCIAVRRIGASGL